MDIFERYMDSSVKYEPRREGDGNVLLSYYTINVSMQAVMLMGGGGVFWSFKCMYV